MTRLPPLRTGILIALLAILSVSGFALWLRVPDDPSDGPRDVPGNQTAAAAGLSPGQVVRKVAAPWLSGARTPRSYADDLVLIALADFGRAAREPDLIMPALSALKARYPSGEIASCEAEPFVSLSYERLRELRDRNLATAYVAQTRRCMATDLRAPDGLVSFWRPDRRRVQVDGRSLDLARSSTPVLIDYTQEVAVRLAHSAALAREPALAGAAADQLALAEHALRDPVTGLWGHARGWYGNRASIVAVPWARGQGWVLRGLVETLAALPATSTERGKVRGILSRLAVALLRYQGRNGLWHQVIDEPGGYAETSGSGMIAGFLAKAVSQGDLPAQPFSESAQRAWRGLQERKIAADGTVYGGARDTPPLASRDAYVRRMTPINDAHAIAGIVIAATGQILLERSAPDAVSRQRLSRRQ